MIIVGRAMPVQDEAPSPQGRPARFDAKPFGMLLESIEALRRNEVYMASGGPIDTARLGDILISRARKLGAAGVVLNAYVRNADATLAVDVPVFARGSYAYGLQHRHNVVDFRCSIVFGNVRIKPSDLIFGDRDGVCIVPREVEQEIVSKAIARSQMEKSLRAAIDAGADLPTALSKHGDGEIAGRSSDMRMNQ